MIRLIFLYLCLWMASTLAMALEEKEVEEVKLSVFQPRSDNISIPFGTTSNNYSTYNIILRGFEGCNENSYQHNTKVDWKTWIIEGFKDHDTMSLGQWFYDNPQYPEWGYPIVDWNSAAAIEFFGPGYKNQEYRSQIVRNLDRHATMQYAWFIGWEIHVRCDDPKKQCLNRPASTTEAYTLHSDVGECSPYEDHINFCPAYFRLPSLDDVIKEVPPSTEGLIVSYWNRAAVWAHEIMHIGWLMSPIDSTWPYMQDISALSDPTWKYYRMIECKFLSFGISTPGPHDAINNPQNYAWFLLANYVVDKLGFYPNERTWFTYMDPPLKGQDTGGTTDVEVFDYTDAGGDKCDPIANSQSMSSNLTTIVVSPSPVGSSSAANTQPLPSLTTVVVSPSSVGASSTPATSAACVIPEGCSNVSHPPACNIVCS